MLGNSRQRQPTIEEISYLGSISIYNSAEHLINESVGKEILKTKDKQKNPTEARIYLFTNLM